MTRAEDKIGTRQEAAIQALLTTRSIGTRPHPPPTALGSRRSCVSFTKRVHRFGDLAGFRNRCCDRR
jgi:hypothetical protein